MCVSCGVPVGGAGVGGAVSAMATVVQAYQPELLNTEIVQGVGEAVVPQVMAGGVM